MNTTEEEEEEEEEPYLEFLNNAINQVSQNTAI
ncbi:hypothetical protein QG37_02558 [Candidozyma auris]|uniref:Uncharacterized protein n=1 Tax=Candidozyma auris TaxID=498019 RepID=A0A0L0P3D0_CANAR|nr:hypothetical protein QG37_02558 [[Candida] auris]